MDSLRLAEATVATCAPYVRNSHGAVVVKLNSNSFCRAWLRARFAPKDEGSASSGSQNVHRAVLVQVHCKHGRSHARAVMYQFGEEFRSAGSFGVAHGPEPVKYSGAERVGIGVAFKMGKQPFAHDEIGDAIAIDVGEGSRVGFGKGHI